MVLSYSQFACVGNSRFELIRFVLFSSSEIPQFRLPYDVVSYEVDLMKDLGVKVRSFLTPSLSLSTAEIRYTAASYI